VSWRLVALGGKLLATFFPDTGLQIKYLDTTIDLEPRASLTNRIERLV